MSEDALLRVDGLVKHFPVTAGVFGREVAQVKAVDGVSFELRRGRTLGLVGESGCGKTTVGEAIVRLLEPTDGRIFFEGRDIARVAPSELRALRRELQIIFQDPYGSLNPRMTVADIVGESLEVHGIARGAEAEARVIATLGKVGIPAAWINRYPHEFSGGQRQRISVARAMALEPKLVVCDEAVSALDVSIQAQVINLLIDLQREMNLAYLFISHDLSVVRHIADEVAVMYLGQIVESAPTDELFGRPAHPYSRSLLSAIPVADPRHRSERIVLEGDVPTPLDPPAGCRFHTRCPAVLDRCRAEEPPAVALGDGGVHRVKCWHAEGLAGDPDWLRVLDERSAAATHEFRRRRAAESPASRFALAAARSAQAHPTGRGSRPAMPTELRGRLRERLGLAGTGLGLLGIAFGHPWLGTGFALLFFGALVLPQRSQRRAWALCFVAALTVAALAGGATSARARARAARAQLDAITAEIDAHRALTGTLPDKIAALEWRLAAIAPDSPPLDPWGGRWLYRVPGGDGRDYDLGSYGPDRELGGGDDVGHPFEEGRRAARRRSTGR